MAYFEFAALMLLVGFCALHAACNDLFSNDFQLSEMSAIRIEMAYFIVGFLLATLDLILYKRYVFSSSCLFVFLVSGFHDVLRMIFFRFNRSALSMISTALYNLLFALSSYLIVTYASEIRMFRFVMIFVIIYRIIGVVRIRWIMHSEIYDSEIRAHSERAEGHRIVFQPLVDYALRSVLHLSLFGSLLAIATFSFGEGPNNYESIYFHFPQDASSTLVIDFMYFLVVTTHTVGYGDVYPIHMYSKIFTILWTMFSSLVFGFILLQLYDLTQRISREISANKNSKER